MDSFRARLSTKGKTDIRERRRRERENLELLAHISREIE